MPRTLPDSDDPGPVLNWRQRQFVDLFISNGRNATLAYQTAYECGIGTAEQGGYRLMANPIVRAAIDAHDAAISAQIEINTGITLSRTVEEIAKVAFFDPRRLFESNGDPVPIRELDDETAANIAGLEVEDRPLIGATIRKYKLSSKMQALDMLMKHLGGYAKNNALDVSVTDKTEVPIAELARRAAFLFRVGGDAMASNEDRAVPRQAAS